MRLVLALVMVFGALASYEKPTKEEWEKNVRKLVSLHDADEDDTITLEEMTAALAKSQKSDRGQAAEIGHLATQHLAAMDKDKDGVVSSNEAAIYFGNMIPGGKLFAERQKRTREAAEKDAPASTGTTGEL